LPPKAGKFKGKSAEFQENTIKNRQKLAKFFAKIRENTIKKAEIANS
jgi:hypothetical protein